MLTKAKLRLPTHCLFALYVLYHRFLTPTLTLTLTLTLTPTPTLTLTLTLALTPTLALTLSRCAALPPAPAGAAAATGLCPRRSAGSSAGSSSGSSARPATPKGSTARPEVESDAKRRSLVSQRQRQMLDEARGLLESPPEAKNVVFLQVVSGK